MAENAEDRFKRAMDRLFSSVSVGQDGSRSVMMTKAVPKRNPRVVDFSAQEENVKPILHHVCRPWNRGDLFRRLSSFKSMTWFGKPEVAGPLICARNGWVNVDVDLIACEGCNTMLSFPCQPTWSQHEVDNAAAAFSKKLESGHIVVCPWKGNACSETLAQFPPAPVEVLVDRFQERCNSLYQLSALPVILNSAIDFLKQSKESQMAQFIAHSPTKDTAVTEKPESSAAGAYFQAQRIISLCGWELRSLPYVVDCEENSADSLEKITQSVIESNFVNTRLNNCGPKVLLYPPIKESGNISDKNSVRSAIPGQKPDLRSAVLDCSLCGASVGLWFFSKIPHPHNRTRVGPLMADTDSLVCEVSAASGVQKGSCDNQIEVNIKCMAKEDAATSNPLKVDTKPTNVLKLNLTIAGGPRPSYVSHPVENRMKNTSDNYDAQDVSQPGEMTLHSEIVEDKGATDMNIRKRKSDVAQEQKDAILLNEVAPCLSSVNAVDTCFTARPESSAESVEMASNYQQSGSKSMECSHFKRQRFVLDGATEHTLLSKAQHIPDGKTYLINFEHGNEMTALRVLDEDDRQKLDSSMYDSRMPVDDSTKRQGITSAEWHKRENGCTFKKLFDESSREFDPILQHRHFCPWVNQSLGRAGCGWQLTLDALEASPAAVKSESASSMYNVDPLSSVRKLFGKPQKK